MSTFIDLYFAGEASPSDIDEWVERWAMSQPGSENLQLHEYLGLTWPEYGLWASAGLLPLAETRQLEMKQEVLQGGAVLFAHGPAVCEKPCPIHWPSLHHMRSWRQHWRADRGIIERICKHDIGHPDPDDKAPFKGHGCDLCCTNPYADAAERVEEMREHLRKYGVIR